MDPKVLDQMLSNSSFTKEQADMIKSKHSFISLKPNEVLLSQGNVCNFEAFLIKGLLRSYYTIEGNERIIQFLKKGTVLVILKVIYPKSLRNLRFRQ